MARDVEVNATASDKTSPGLRSVERSFKESQKRIQKDQKDASEKFGKSLGTTLSNVAPNLTKKLVSALDSVGAASGPILAGGIAAAAPVIAGTLQAAVVGGAGIGGVLGGVLLVSRDARVKAAGGELASQLMGQLQQDATPFIQPVLSAVDTIGERASKLDPLFQRIFSNASKYVQPLTSGLLDFAEPVIRGFDKLVAAAGPVIESIRRGMGQLGQATEDTLTSLAEDSDSAAKSLDGVFDTVSGLIRVVGPLVDGVTKLYNALDKVGLAAGLLTTIGRVMDDNSKSSGTFVARQRDVATSFQESTDDATDYAAGLRDAQAAVQGVYEANRDLYSSTTDVESAFRNASKAAKDNGKTLSLNKADGLANRDALSDLAGALQRNYDAYVKVNGAGAGSAALASTLRSRFIALAEKMGASSGRATELADKLLGIPNVNRRVNVATDQARANADALKAQLAGIKDRTVYVDVAFNQGRINKVEAQLARLNHAGLSGDTGWAPTAGGAGARTGGPAQVNVSSTVEVTLDGAPFRAMVARTVDRANARQAWRQRVGGR